MAIKTLSELTKLMTDRFGETPSDEELSLLEDLTDTYHDLEAKGSNEEWQKEKVRLEQAVIDKDNEWRKKYTERFVHGSDKPSAPPQFEDEDENERMFEIGIDDLFSPKK